MLLNVTIADELRRLPRQAASMSIPGMESTKRLVSLIVASDPTAAELLLGLVDDQSRSRYWQSLEHETRLVLSLIDIDNKCPLLRHSEVRGWVREELLCRRWFAPTQDGNCRIAKRLGAGFGLGRIGL
jgi:hypothetical protein